MSDKTKAAALKGRLATYNQEDQWHVHHRWLVWLLVGVLLLWIIWMLWSVPIMKMLSSAFDTGRTEQQVASRTAAGTSDSNSGTGATTPSSGSTTNTTSTTTTTRGSSTTGQPSSTTTTGTTPGVSTPTGTPPSSGGNGLSVGATTGSSAGLVDFYAQVGNGQNEQQLISLAGSAPTGCSTLQVALLGNESVCTWSNKNTSVLVTLLNNQVVSKAKIGF